MLHISFSIFFLFPGIGATADPDLADIVINASRDDRKLMLQWYCYQRFHNRQVCAELATNVRTDGTTPNPTYSSKHTSLMLLAMRATFDVDNEVIKTLLDNITLRDRSISAYSTILPPHLEYPALMALIRVGSRARDQIFQRIKETDDTKVLEYLAYWFSVQYGKKYSVIILDDYIKSSKLTNIEIKRIEQVRNSCQRSDFSIP